jgi:hypothetical protein
MINMKYRLCLDLIPGGSSTADPEAGRARFRFSTNMPIIAIETERLAWLRLLGAALHCAIAQEKLCCYRVVSPMHIIGFQTLDSPPLPEYINRVHFGIMTTKTVFSRGNLMT